MDILKIAQECGLGEVHRGNWNWDDTAGELRLADFANRIIEECAHLCDIREREYDTHTSQTNRGAAIGARYCASAIRALAKG